MNATYLYAFIRERKKDMGRGGESEGEKRGGNGEVTERVIADKHLEVKADFRMGVELQFNSTILEKIGDFPLKRQQYRQL